MKKQFIMLTSVFMILCLLATAQDKYFTKSGRISFVSKGNVEAITAKHKGITCVLDTKSGAIQFAVLMKGFEFAKALMQEHFNENYLESDKFPRAGFKGQVINNGAVNYTKDGTYPVNAKGILSLHGVNKEIEVPGKIIVKDGKPQLFAAFNILLSDYDIRIPSLVKENISNIVAITVEGALEPLNN
jgi:hypothetical protein